MHTAVAALEANLGTLKEQLSIAVIYGGDKKHPGACLYQTHNPRGTKTYQAVAENIASSLRRAGFERVMTLPEDVRLLESLQRYNIDLVICNSGGLQGYNPMSHLPALMEMAGLPYVGHNPINATLLDNKHIFKRELRCLGFPTPDFAVVHLGENNAEMLTQRLHQRFPDASTGFIVKPVSGRASLHVVYAETHREAAERALEVQRVTANTVLIEAYLPGREFVVSVAGPVVSRGGQLQAQDEPLAFSVFERNLEADERIFTSMDKRAIDSSRIRPLGDSDEALRQAILFLGQRLYRCLALRSLIRIDLRMDENGDLKIMEANPKPDLAQPSGGRTSLVCQGLEQEQMQYDDLIESLLLNEIVWLLTTRPGNVPHIAAMAGLQCEPC